jgi:hypothetical protein
VEGCIVPIAESQIHDQPFQLQRAMAVMVDLGPIELNEEAFSEIISKMTNVIFHGNWQEPIEICRAKLEDSEPSLDRRSQRCETWPHLL